MTDIREPQDQLVRNSIVEDIHESIFITAGAGAGKTKSIVDRIVQLLTDEELSRRVKMSNIVAITFTTKAAAELRNRLRERLLDKQVRAKLSPNQIEAADVALTQLDAAPVGTIHAFAMRILQQYPLEAGLPIGFSLMDTAESKRSNRSLSNQILDELYTTEDKANLDLLKDAGISVKKMREFVNDLQEKQPQLVNASFEIVQEDFFNLAISQLVIEANNWWNINRDQLIDKNDRLTSKTTAAIEESREAISNGNYDLAVDALLALRNLKGSNEDAAKYKEFKDLLIDRLKWHKNQNSAKVELIIRRWAHHAQRRIIESQSERKIKGNLDFNDLLLIAHNLILQNSDVRRDLHRKLLVYVVDEFQDTDPLQWSIIRALVADPETPSGEPKPGRLVAVGDPKQSIYRFRGADLATFERVRKAATTKWSDDSVKHLTTNFRSHPSILKYVDHLYDSRPKILGTDFERMIPYSLEIETDRVSVLQGGGDDKVNMELDAVAATVQYSVRNLSLPVKNPLDADSTSSRKVIYSDIALLIPARTSLVNQLEVFERYGIPYTSTDATIVYSRPAVRGLIAAIKVIAGSVNGGDLWWALKSPLFGLSDDEMLKYKKISSTGWPVPISAYRGDHENPETGTSIATTALKKLYEIWKDYRTAQPSEILEILLSETRAQEALDQIKTGRFENDCLRMVILHAKSWEAGGGNGIVDYIDWLKQMEDENTRENLPSPDNKGFDAVTISTIHSAKGLEYPVVILGGMWNQVKDTLPSISLSTEGKFEFNLGENAKSLGYVAQCERLEKQLNLEERHRLLYVGATRAEHYLFVSNHHRGDVQGGSSNSSTQKRKCWAMFNFEAVEKAISLKIAQAISPEIDGEEASWKVSPMVQVESQDRLNDILEAQRISKAVSYIRPSDAGRRREENEVVTPESAYGNALHSVMYSLARAKFDKGWKHLAHYLRLSASEHGVLDRIIDLERDVLAILEAPLIQRAKQAGFVRPEVSLMDMRGNQIIRGSADLVFADTAGSELVLIDYKTNKDLTADKKAKYKEQLDDYAKVLEKTFGRQVTQRFLIHVHEGVVSEISV